MRSMRSGDASGCVRVVFSRMALAALLAVVLNVGLMAAEEESPAVGVTVSGAYASRYIWHGYDLLWDNDGAWQPSVAVEMGDFTLTGWGSWAAEDRAVHRDADELDYILGYSHTFFADELYAVELGASYTYFDYPQSDSVSGLDGVADGQELSISAALPKAFCLFGSHLVPSYSAFYEFDGIQNHEDVDNGWLHAFGLSYDIPVRPLIRGQDEQAITLKTDITYNDGAYGSDADWSHVTAGAETTFEWKGLEFTPAVYYQWSMEDTVNPNDEFYGVFTVSYTF